MISETYLDATQEAGKAFYQKGLQGEIIMLNLLKFKEQADYSQTPELAPTEKISGYEAYERYIEHTLPFLEEAGGEILFQGTASHYLIGPQTMVWDQVLLVKHKSVQTFLQFAQNEEYLQGIGHRTAALEDARLLPIQQTHNHSGSNKSK